MTKCWPFRSQIGQTQSSDIQYLQEELKYSGENCVFFKAIPGIHLVAKTSWLSVHATTRALLSTQWPWLTEEKKKSHLGTPKIIKKYHHLIESWSINRPTNMGCEIVWPGRRSEILKENTLTKYIFISGWMLFQRASYRGWTSPLSQKLMNLNTLLSDTGSFKWNMLML